jgi:hypothetical protein
MQNDEDLSIDNDEEEDLISRYEIIVDKGQEPTRIDKFLTDRLERISRTKMQAAAIVGNLTVNGTYNGTVVRSFNGNTGAVQGVSTLTNSGPNGAFISLTGSTGNINIGNRGVHSVNGITGTIFLSEGSTQFVV